MDKWIQAIFEATGIPLKEQDVALALCEDKWWLLLHLYPVLQVGAAPNPREDITPAARAGLAWAMKQRLSESIPRVQRLVETMDRDRAGDVSIEVVNADEGGAEDAYGVVLDRGWPHYLLRLSAGGFDVEVDLNPYVPDEPFELDELRRQAGVILQVAGGGGA